MKKFTLLLGILIATNVIAAAPDTLWTKTFGGASNEFGYSVQSVSGGSDSGFIIVGSTYSFGAGGADIYLVRVNSSGDTLWTRTYGGANDDNGYSVQQTFDGGFIVGGYRYTGDYKTYIIKTNSSGDTLWTRDFGVDSCNVDSSYLLIQCADSGFIIAERVWKEISTDGYIYLIKTNSSGDTIWTKTYSGANWKDVYLGASAQQTQDGGFIVTGSKGSGTCDVILIKLDSLGDTLWTKIFGGSDRDYGYSVQQTFDGGFIVTGWTWSFGAGSFSNMYLIRTDSLGDTLWTRFLGGTDYEKGYSVQQTFDEGFIVAGVTNSFGAGNYDTYLIKTNSSGDSLWTKTFGGTTADYGSSVQQTEDGGFVVLGYTYSFGAGGYSDIYLVRLGQEKPETGHISGNVWNENSYPIPNAYVHAFGDSGSEGYACTDSNGSYTITDITAGHYYVEVIATGYIHEFYNNVNELKDAMFLSVVNKQTTSNINFILSPTDTSVAKHHITGTVVNSTGDPLSCMVFAFKNDSESYTGTTDANGKYTINGLDSVKYSIYAWAPGYIGEFYDTSLAWEMATEVTPTADDIDFALAPASKNGKAGINGKITSNKGTPLENVMVYAINTTKGEDEVIECARTSPNGRYIIDKLPAGSYTIKTSIPFHNTSNYYQSVNVHNNTISNINISMSRTGVEEKRKAETNYIIIKSPNPAIGKVAISYNIPFKAQVVLEIYDNNGRLRRTLVNSQQSANSYAISWDGRDNFRKKLPSGMYFCQLKAGELKSVKKIIFIR
ncbi:MAG: carboxypeptidase regulatory-like domain-containing protein [bacterium]|nr:carboxypeptidase regulatory-like domain-containing protein [bacterium]